MKSPKEILQEYWGYDAFRPIQEDIILSVLKGKDTLAVLPTGGGKSICFQVPALLMNGTCLVISPLIALMLDQVEKLNALGIPSRAIYTGMSTGEIEDIMIACEEGDIKFLYISPERLISEKFLDRLQDFPIALLAIDEAHCISQWGYDFRPAYLHISEIKPLLKKIPTIALTASATNKVKDDIVEKLKLQQPAIFFGSFKRENLSYHVSLADDKINALINILRKQKGSSIVYCKTRKKTKEISDLLNQFQFNTDFYHAGLTQDQRNEKQRSWLKGETKCMICTNAFGMGIDKPDVRLVVHMDVPDCLENYYQEAGRAGRDGAYAEAILLFRKQELEELKTLPDQKFPSITVIRKIYRALCNHFQLPTGVGSGTWFDFDIQSFTLSFNLNLYEVLYSLEVLKQEELLTYQDQVFTPSTVYFSTDRTTLETFEKQFPDLEPLIKMLLRTYGGIFDHATKINERQISWLLKSDIQKVKSSLKTLHKFGIIDYRPAKENAQIHFLHDRFVSDELNIDYENYQSRKREYTIRIEKIIGYVQANSCRASFISSYFGDDKNYVCGICDICIKKQEKHFQDERSEDLIKKIKNILNDHPKSLNEISQSLECVPEKLKNVLRFLEEEGVVQMNLNGTYEMK